MTIIFVDFIDVYRWIIYKLNIKHQALFMWVIRGSETIDK